MEKKDHLEIWLVVVLFLTCLLSVKIYSLVFGVIDFQEAILKSNNTSYVIYKDEEELATVHDYDAMASFLTNKFNNKIGNDTNELFFGDGISVIEQQSQQPNQNDTVDVYEKIANEADFKIEAIRVIDMDLGKEYYIKNKKVWDDSINRVQDAVVVADDESHSTNSVVLGNAIEIEKVWIDISKVIGEAELVSAIMNENHDEYTTVDTTNVQKISEETGVTSAEILALNPTYSQESVILPNVELEVTDGTYKNNFTKIKTIEVDEAIPYEIKYVDDETQYTNVEQVVQNGIDGVQTVQLTVKDLTSGERVVLGKDILKTKVQPQEQIVIRGTMEAPDVGTGNFIWPTASRRTSTEFGNDILFGQQRFHSGIDINEGFGAPIMAIDNGVVIESSFNSSYGNYIIINHNNGFYSLYAHNQSNNVRVGQIVPQGEVIAYMGSTGLSTGPHLHLEIRQGVNSKDGAVDPRIYIS